MIPLGAEISYLDNSLEFERQPLTSEQIELVREVVEQRAPHLRAVVDGLAEPRVLPAAEIEALESVISWVMSEEVDKRGKYNERGLALDELIGFVCQWSEAY